MGLWPPKRAAAGATVAPSPPPPPAPAPAPATAPAPSPWIAFERARQPAPERPITWDPASTRALPVAHQELGSRLTLDPPETVEPRRRRRALKRVAAVVGTLLVTLVMLVTVGPRFLPYQTYFVRSGSMEPTVHVGSMVVLTKTTADKLVVGNIITFDNPDKPGTLVTHRIVGIENNTHGRFFRTKGDANGTQDSWQVPAKGTGWKYAFNVPYLGYAFGYLGTTQARIALLAIPGFILGLLTLIDIWRPKPKSRAR
jgi:signal peptidase